MPDVLIRNLRLRVVRKNGLFWNDDPRGLARRALGLLPELLALELSELEPEGDDVEITEPVRLRLTGSAQALREAMAMPGEPATRALIRTALERAMEAGATRRPARVEDTVEGPEPHGPGMAPLGELLQLFLRGELGKFLDRLPAHDLEAYHRVLLERASEGPAPVAAALAGAGATSGLSQQELAEAERLLEVLAAGFDAAVPLLHRPAERRTRLSQRLLAVVQVAAETGIPPFEPALRAVLDRLLPLRKGARAEDASAPSDQVTRTPDAQPQEASARSTAASRPREPKDSTRVSARQDRAPRPMPPAEPYLERDVPMLPLLVAVALARAGITARVEAHLQDSGHGEDLPLWIAALTFKLGPRPVRGWMYPQAVWEHAAILSGSNLFSGEGLVRLADDPALRWPELTDALLDVLAPPEARLIAAPLGSEIALALMEPLAPVWAGPRSAAGIRTAAECPPELKEALRESLDALTDRPACPLATRPALDWHLTVVTGWALGHIGHRLWPEESPPVPLVLERFASLEARARRDEEGLSVRVPLGRRHADLLRAGFLSNLERVPWLFGGSIRFRGA